MCQDVTHLAWILNAQCACHAARASMIRPRLCLDVMQATLQKLLQRLAVDHPHHTLYQLFALKNGNRSKDGRVAQAGDVVGGMTVTVDHDKVAAAHDLLVVIAANPARYASHHLSLTCMS